MFILSVQVVRPILNAPIETFANEPGVTRNVNRYGAVWTLGVRARF
jgi:hypothetical protein